jgi:outer membrane protein OmpA-like peptidoglycan-associated protein
MKTSIKFLLITGIFLMPCMASQAQFLKKLGDAAKDAAEKATIRKAEQKAEDAVNRSIDKATDPNTYKGEGNDNSQTSKEGNNNRSAENDENGAGSAVQGASGKAATPKALEMAYAKSDFVPGDEIIFEDYMNTEQLGEFPSQWELLRGNAEIASVGGKKIIAMDGQDSWIEPLMKTPKNYLGDVFTLEFDYLQMKENEVSGRWELDFMGPEDGRDHDVFTITWYNATSYGEKEIHYAWTNNSGRSDGKTTVKLAPGEWHHIAVSFNKRALKVYFNGNRIANVPNVSYPPGWVTFWTGNGETGKNTFIKDVRIAKGAVPLYDRLMNNGKIITYGITFDVGKSTLKPESMVEINRIATLMKENPDLKFSVEGHTDNTGNAASNQTLSDERSKAVVNKLVELGISNDRLKSTGKGQTSSIADNSTDEGRAKNRRVEFVKL